MASGYSLEPGWKVALAHLEEKERGLERACLADELRHGGLVDLESRLRLCQTRLAICLIMLEAMASNRKTGAHRRLYTAAARRARDAVREMEEVRDLNVSEDQKSQVTGHADYQEALRLLGELMAEGGGVLLEPLVTDPRRDKAVLRAVAGALRKYAHPDDVYAPFLGAPDPDRRSFLRSLVTFLFPTLTAEHGDGTRCGIEEADEGLSVSGRLRMPLRQAIHYTERHLLPSLRRTLAEYPGEPQVQDRVLALERQLGQLKRLRFTPRSTPVVLEKGFHTEWISNYTPDGELLVSVVLPVTGRTGTNLGRTQELAFAEVVRRLAGRGVCRRLDEQYRFLRSVASGLRGNSRLPSSRLDTTRAFGALKRDFPSLDALESPQVFRRLVMLARRRDRKALERGVRRILSGRAGGSDVAAFLTS